MDFAESSVDATEEARRLQKRQNHAHILVAQAGDRDEVVVHLDKDSAAVALNRSRRTRPQAPTSTASCPPRLLFKVSEEGRG